MIEKIVCTILILLLQCINLIYGHMKYHIKKYDIINAIYQVIIFTLFQIVIWIIL